MEKDDVLELKDKIQDFMTKKELGIDDRYWLCKLLYTDAETELENFMYGDEDGVDEEPEVDDIEIEPEPEPDIEDEAAELETDDEPEAPKPRSKPKPKPKPKKLPTLELI